MDLWYTIKPVFHINKLQINYFPDAIYFLYLKENKFSLFNSLVTKLKFITYNHEKVSVNF